MPTPNPPGTAPYRPRVRMIDPSGVYWCESRRHPGSGHRTTALTCTCPNPSVCWHMNVVRQLERARGIPGTPAPLPPPAPPSTATMDDVLEAFGD